MNEWVSAIVFLLAAGFLVVDWLRHRHDPAEAVVRRRVVDAEEVEAADEVEATEDRSAEAMRARISPGSTRVR